MKLSKKMTKEMMKAMKEFHEANKNKVCEVCGSGIGECALFEVHQISDSKYFWNGSRFILCHDCLSGKQFIDFWSAI